jgi:AGCS family alanine or glycine:cation symporter
LGSAPIAHATAKTKHSVRPGLIAMLGPFIDTIVVCSLTGLVIVLFGVLSGYRHRYQRGGLSNGGYIPRGNLAVL